ncbi:hypothetical protein [Mycolicibacterium wolinskyi]|uniref:hypothetical protein n=1 Tax=Mycolicibacterium wolinskyi TaxID=59750 RepID=UPI0039179145
MRRATAGDGRIIDPHVRIDIDWADEGGLNSDQARELAALLLESAALIDGWVQ